MHARSCFSYFHFFDFWLVGIVKKKEARRNEDFIMDILISLNKKNKVIYIYLNELNMQLIFFLLIYGMYLQYYLITQYD